MQEVSKSKLKLLYLMDILLSKTDDENILNAIELCEELEKKYNIKVERKAIYNDINVLIEYGVDINVATKPKRGFYVANRDFEVAEIKLLIDAVQTASFITPKKTKQLIEKVNNELSVFQAQKLSQYICIENRAKCKNEQIYYNIDYLSKAIDKEKQVKLVYIRHRREKDSGIIKSKKELTVNPYALIWKNEHYYLVGNNPRYNNLMHLRLDRMKNVEVLDENARPYSEVCDFADKFDCAVYSKRTFNMYSGETEKIKLICDNSIIDDIFDRFGDNIVIRDFDDENFLICVNVAMSTGLVSWIMQYGELIKVEYPEKLKSLLIDKSNEILSIYR